MPIFTARATAQAGPAASISVRAGDGQVGVVGRPLQRAVVAVAVDRLGNPVPDARIEFVPASGSVPFTPVRADSIGQARARWTLGQVAGKQRMAVRLEGASSGLELTARARAGAAARLEFLRAQPAAASRHSPFTTVAVHVTDRLGNAVPDQQVRFRGSNGSVSPRSVVTDAKGKAQARWTPAGKGKHSVVAEVPGSEARDTLTLP